MGARFSISFDESTTARNRRYVNINLHNENDFHSLGMVRVEGIMSAERAVDLVKGRLSKFNLNLDNDIVATITDGASIMNKFGRITSPLHCTCFAHAIHLSVCDVLYKTRDSSVPHVVDYELDADDEDDDEEDEETLASVLISEFSGLISRVRKIARLFRKSPVKNDDILQPHIVRSFGKEYQLLLDTKTRWNSLLNMLRRFYKVRKEVEMAMVSKHGRGVSIYYR